MTGLIVGANFFPVRIVPNPLNSEQKNIYCSFMLEYGFLPSGRRSHPSHTYLALSGATLLCWLYLWGNTKSMFLALLQIADNIQKCFQISKLAGDAYSCVISLRTEWNMGPPVSPGALGSSQPGTNTTDTNADENTIEVQIKILIETQKTQTNTEWDMGPQSATL